MDLHVFQFILNFLGSLLHGCNFMHAQEAVQQPAVQVWNQTDYEAWKQEQIERSKSYHYTPSRHIEELLEKFDHTIIYKDLFSQKMALYAYNTLRELHNEHINQQIDQAWLSRIRYENFKENKRLRWQNSKYAFAEQIDDLLQNVHEYLPRQYDNDQRRALYAYNFARKLLKESTINATHEIDQEWLSRVGYDYWKQAKLVRWQKLSKQHVQQIDDLIDGVDDNMHYSSSTYARTYALYAYNFIRELFHEPVITSLEQIDETWFDKIMYENFKEKKQFEWQKHNKSISEQFHYLHDDMDHQLSYKDRHSQRQALFAYNFARELFKQPTVGSTKEIDQEWLKLTEYDYWKDTIKNRFKKSDIMLVKNPIEILTTEVRDNLAAQGNEQHALRAYNALRESFDEPAVLSAQEISQDWIKNIEEEIEAVTLVELNQGTLLLPTIAQQELVREARILTNLINDKRLILAIDSAFCNPNIIAITETADLNIMLFHIYHELGHIKNGDIEKGSPQALFNGERFVSGQTIEHFDKDHPNTSAHLKKVEEYVARAKEKIDTTTSIGKILKEQASKTTTFWNPPQQTKEYMEIIFGRAQESRADLFAVEELLQQKQLDPILTIIQDWGSSGYLVAREGDEHPSGVERALYIAGYLFSKGVDVNKELSRWEHEGTCPDSSKKYGEWNPLYETKITKFMAAYKQNKDERNKLEYELWKKEKDAKSAHDIMNLALKLYDWLEQFNDNSDNRFVKKELLYGYNFLRELQKLPTINSMNQIDNKWLETVSYNYFVQWEQDVWKQENRTTLPEHVINLVANCSNYLAQAHAGKNLEKAALHAYNYLRIILQLSPIAKLQEIDMAWFDATGYDYYKQRERDNWDKKNLKTVPQKINRLIFLVDRDLSESGAEFQRFSRYSYNMIRELLGQPMISSLDQIDNDWLDRIGYDYWKKRFKEKFENEGPQAFTARINLVVWFINAYRFEKSKNDQRRARYSYNVLREMLHQPTINSVDQIDITWLDNTAFDYWQKNKQLPLG